MDVNVSKINSCRDVHDLIQSASRLNSRFALITEYMTALVLFPTNIRANRKRAYADNIVPSRIGNAESS